MTIPVGKDLWLIPSNETLEKSKNINTGTKAAYNKTIRALSRFCLNIGGIGELTDTELLSPLRTRNHTSHGFGRLALQFTRAAFAKPVS